MASHDTMGHIPTNDPMHVCDNCEGTWTGTEAEIKAAGWKRHNAGPHDSFLLCGDCEVEFAERRRQRALGNAA